MTGKGTVLSAIVELFLGLLKSWTRTTAFIGKDVIEVVRRPGALFSLILGPFLIMGLFGIGYSGQSRPLNAVLVVPASANLPRDITFYQQFTGDSVNLAGHHRRRGRGPGALAASGDRPHRDRPG